MSAERRTGSQVEHQPELGTLVISIDLEMNWGTVHRGGAVAYDIDQERTWMGMLLDLFDRHEIPATWATVGHLLVDGCDRHDGSAHPDIERPDYAWFDGDWFGLAT